MEFLQTRKKFDMKNEETDEIWSIKKAFYFRERSFQ